MELSKQEYGMLIEALDAWVQKDLSGRLMGAFLTATLSDKLSDDKKAELEKQEKEREDKYERDKIWRDETATILKAKLIEARNNKLVSELMQ